MINIFKKIVKSLTKLITEGAMAKRAAPDQNSKTKSMLTSQNSA